MWDDSARTAPTNLHWCSQQTGRGTIPKGPHSDTCFHQRNKQYEPTPREPSFTHCLCWALLLKKSTPLQFISNHPNSHSHPPSPNQAKATATNIWFTSFGSLLQWRRIIRPSRFTNESFCSTTEPTPPTARPGNTTYSAVSNWIDNLVLQKEFHSIALIQTRFQITQTEFSSNLFRFVSSLSWISTQGYYPVRLKLTFISRLIFSKPLPSM